MTAAKKFTLAAREPLAIRAAAVAVVTAVIGVLVSFHVNLSSDQQGALVGLVAVAAPLVAAVLARGSVTANAKVIASVTDEGQVANGDAASEPTGEHAVLAESPTGQRVPLIAVKRGLVSQRVDIPHKS